MAIEPDDSEYGGRTVASPAWPNVDEDTLADVAESFENFAKDLRDVTIPDAQKQMMELSDSWEGSGGRAAVDRASALIDEHKANMLASLQVAKKFRTMEAFVVRTKNAANENAEQVQGDCEILSRDSTLEAEDRKSLIEARIESGLAENAGQVASNAQQLAGSLGIDPEQPGGAGKVPGIVPPPRQGQTQAQNDGRRRDHPMQSFTSTGWSPHAAGARGSAPAPSVAEPAPPEAPPAPIPHHATRHSQSPGSTSAGGSGGGTSSGSGSSSSSGSSKSVSSGSNSSPSGSDASQSSGQAGQGGPMVSPAAAGGKGPDPMGQAGKPVPTAPPPTAPPTTPQTPLGAPAPTQQPVPPPTPATTTSAAGTAMSGSGGGGSSGGGTGGGAPHVGAGAGPSTASGPAPMPLAPPATPAPAAPTSAPAGTPTGPATPTGPGVSPASTNSHAAAAGAAAPVPVSSARAERDAIAAASTAGAVRRKSSGNDPRQLARHIVAALNVGITDMLLYWVGAVTRDGQILVANNYGLSYIPDGVNLPGPVRMVSADESIPAATRGAWATYPLLALQGWATEHQTSLSAIVGMGQHLAGTDLGVYKDFLAPDDLPDNSEMQGRSRLEVLAPAAAATLAAVAPADLTDQLPPAPVDTTAPVDRTGDLKVEIFKTLNHSNPERIVPHLQAMVACAEHLQELAVFRAQTAVDAAQQRAAIADWVYWQHVSVLNADAVAGMKLMSNG